ncbi:glycoside hydrolase family 3 protein [Pseudarthrobacter psychrotolerans]|uniref:beta-glucosidase n=1 Tax=Pseudarthrobacter psychrotolerans TaxID=2697569 RepID=A0A6P1NJ46_9MICC|nr:glycoside hydrolase family 3 N-terminal domain-containing protein [Pseudarthrobacter psychrotolerans]QHK18494.1 glycoside hydrolase family 3 protein [Pseudarthrobacter psychrotolerans]
MTKPLRTLTSPDGTVFRDLNNNGTMEPYENPKLAVAKRVADLVSRLSVEEKAGLMFQPMVEVGPHGELIEDAGMFGGKPTSHLLQERFVNHFNVLSIPGPGELAGWHNQVQQRAEQTPHGIPVTISTDPRHSFTDNMGASFAAGAFSQWPEPLGFGALDDAETTEHFADICRKEYRAVGIRAALHPTADLATEPRWARQSGTFGADAAVAGRQLAAMLRGFQGSGLSAESVACTTKHFPGGGPQKDGEDPHFDYGREQVYPGSNEAYHRGPFEAAFAAGTSAVMPYYGMPVGLEVNGKKVEEVGFGFNKDVITGILRGHYGYDGVVCTDWGLVSDGNLAGIPFPARAWGVEHLTASERAAKIIDAGCDQFGGENDTGLVLGLVRAGIVSEARLDESVARLLKVKFELGLFEDPFVNEAEAAGNVGRAEYIEAGFRVQQRSITLLKNAPAAAGSASDNDGGRGQSLPLATGIKVFLDGVAAAEASRYATVVETVEEADVAIVRLRTPFEPRTGNFLEQLFHAGSLEFDAATISKVSKLADAVPTVVDVYLERPAVMPEIAAAASVLTANYGSSDRALLSVLFGEAQPEGSLPFELPSSTAAIEAASPDVPNDTAAPLFECGFGLRYAAVPQEL